jgi:hypothetical protein
MSKKGSPIVELEVSFRVMNTDLSEEDLHKYLESLIYKHVEAMQQCSESLTKEEKGWLKNLRIKFVRGGLQWSLPTKVRKEPKTDD